MLFINLNLQVYMPFAQLTKYYFIYFRESHCSGNSLIFWLFSQDFVIAMSTEFQSVTSLGSTENLVYHVYSIYNDVNVVLYTKNSCYIQQDKFIANYSGFNLSIGTNFSGYSKVERHDIALRWTMQLGLKFFILSLEVFSIRGVH